MSPLRFLPASDFLESLLLRRSQQLADAGTHAVWKAGNLTACRTDRLTRATKVFERATKQRVIPERF
jgi:hypothetical protein